jgi:hypothetical protein
LQNAFIYFFILTPPTSLVHNSLSHSKLLWNRHLKLYKPSCNSKTNKTIFNDFLRGSKIGYKLLNQECFVKTTPLTYFEGPQLSHLQFIFVDI